MEVKDLRIKIKESIKEILDAEFREDMEKEISYLIFNVQLYERKGGKKDLW